MGRMKMAEAQTLLVELNRQFPDREEILAPLALTHYHLNQLPAYLMYCIQLNRLLPNDAEHRLALGEAYLMNGRIALAALAFRQFLARWPGHEEAARAQERLNRIESGLSKIMAQLGLSGDNAVELAALHEESQVLMEAGKYREGIAKAEELLKHEPNYTAAYNNISLMRYHSGEVARAVAAAERVLELDPVNFHALGNLARFLLVVGRGEEAREHVEKLKRVDCDYFDRWLKQAEACATLGDDQGVLDALAGGEATGLIETAINGFHLYHLAAVARLRLGSEDEARSLWEKCLSLTPDIIAVENLNDLDNPVYQRNGPWSFPFKYWISPHAIDDLQSEARKLAKRDVKDLMPAVRRFLRKHPYVENLLPILFDRGDLAGREFALKLATWIKTPETIALLRQFGLGQRGPDRLRINALREAQQLGGLDSGIVRFWANGDWQDLRLQLTEIYEGVESDLPPLAQDYYLKAYEAQENGDAVHAEILLKAALALVPDSPQLLNNLAAAYALQGRSKEYAELLRKIIERHPDYVFARINFADLIIEEGRYEEAEALLVPLGERPRLHLYEVIGIQQTYLHLHFRRGNLELARECLRVWEDLAPDDARLKTWRRRLGRESRIK